MHLSIDFGASTLDTVVWKGDDYTCESYEYKPDFDFRNWRDLLKSKDCNLGDFDKISITGGRSSLIRDDVSIVNEIDAIGWGGSFLVRDRLKDDFVVASLGTGTCLVHVHAGQVKHLGGTGVGGGTFLALSRELFGITDIDEIRALYEKGSRENVDLSVEEVLGSGIGIISGEVTASNLGKVARDVDFRKEDLAAGVVNLIGQTIATAACFSAKSVAVDKVVLTGKLTRVSMIMDVIKRAAGLYGVTVILPHDADFVSAIGAGANPVILNS